MTVKELMGEELYNAWQECLRISRAMYFAKGAKRDELARQLEKAIAIRDELRATKISKQENHCYDGWTV